MDDLRVKAVSNILNTYKHGKGRLILADLAKRDKFIDALATDVGQELLRDAIQHADILLSKIINEDANEKDRAEYRVYKRIIEKWAQRVENYISILNKVVGGSK